MKNAGRKGVVDDAQQAFDDEDYDLLCNELYTTRPAELLGSVGPGVTARSERSMTPMARRQATITLKRIGISGDTAIVDVIEGETDERWTLLKQKGVWRIDNLVVTEPEPGGTR